MTIAELLCGAADSAATIAVSGGRRIDLQQFRRDVAANADAIRALGCRRGLLVTRDAYWAAVGMLALFQAEAIVVMPANALPGTLRDLAGEWDHLICDVPPEDAAGVLTLRDGDGSAAPLVRREPETGSIELFTSGSTGVPKRVVKSLARMEREAAALEALLGHHLNAQSVVTGTVSHQHLYGLSFRLFWPLCNGRPFDATVHEFWESLEAHAGSVIVTSPAHLQRLSGLAARPLDDRPALILSAGAPLPPSAAAEARACFGAPIVEIYGSTETNTIAWRDGACADARWIPLPEVQIRQTADGRIALRSPFLSGDGLHEGADLIRLHDDGTFELQGRADRIAKIEGKRISLPEVERRLLELAAVSAAAALVLPGEKPRLAAVIVPSEAGARELAKLGPFRFSRKLRKSLGQSIEAAGLPRHWRFVDALPTGALGKIKADDLVVLFDAPREPDLRAIRAGDHWVELDLFNRRDLQQLDGHFPAIAIVPGVAQIDWAVKLAARHLRLPIEIATSLQVKFHRVTLADTLVTLRLEHDAARQRLTFAYRKPDQQMLTSGSIRLEAS